MKNFNNNINKNLKLSEQKITSLLFISNNTTSKQLNYTLKANNQQYKFLIATETISFGTSYGRAKLIAQTFLKPTALSSSLATITKLLSLINDNCPCSSTFNTIIYLTGFIVLFIVVSGAFVDKRFYSKFPKLNSLKRRV